MNIALWVVQGILALMFLMAGLTKLSKSEKELAKSLGDWVNGYGLSKIRLIGLVEVLGAIGLILPGLLSFLPPVLTPLAAAGLAITMIGAMQLHLKRQEKDKLKMNLMLFIMATFVVIGRLFL